MNKRRRRRRRRRLIFQKSDHTKHPAAMDWASLPSQQSPPRG